MVNDLYLKEIGKRRDFMEQHQSKKRSASQSKKGTSKSISRIVRQPSEEDLIPTEREQQLLQELFDWQKRSRETNWILGQPLGVRP